MKTDFENLEIYRLAELNGIAYIKAIGNFEQENKTEE